MKLGKKIIERTTQTLNLPTEAVPGFSHLELVGFGQVKIEGHQGILHYSQEKISFGTPHGVVDILGQNLTIGRMNSLELTICGTISQVLLTEVG